MLSDSPAPARNVSCFPVCCSLLDGGVPAVAVLVIVFLLSALVVSLLASALFFLNLFLFACVIALFATWQRERKALHSSPLLRKYKVSCIVFINALRCVFCFEEGEEDLHCVFLGEHEVTSSSKLVAHCATAWSN